MSLALALVVCGVMFSCSKSEEPIPASPPTITVIQKQVNVYGSAVLTIIGNELRISDEPVASWSDKNNEKCECTVTVGGKTVKS